MIDIEQLAKIAYESRHPKENEVEWKDATCDIQECYRTIAKAQKEFIERAIHKHLTRIFKRIANWVILRLIPSIQYDISFRERTAIIAKLMEDLTKLKPKKLQLDEPEDCDDIPFEFGDRRPDLSPENF